MMAEAAWNITLIVTIYPVMCPLNLQTHEVKPANLLFSFINDVFSGHVKVVFMLYENQLPERCCFPPGCKTPTNLEAVSILTARCV